MDSKGENQPEVEAAQNGRPWEDHGPRIMKSIPLSEIDAADKRFQFRFPSTLTKLGKSLASRGQLNPIKIMPGDGAYVMIDGFSRFAEAKRQGWDEIKALIYPTLTERDAKKISWECNIVRVNLCFAEKANAMLVARSDGLTRKEVASLFRMSERQVNRYLELPEQLREFVDGKTVTMAHARVLKDYVDKVTQDDLEGLIEWIRSTSASSKTLKAKTKSANWVGTSPGRPRTFGCVERRLVRGYSFELRPQSSNPDRAAACAFLREAMREIDSWTRLTVSKPENETDRTCGEPGC